MNELSTAGAARRTLRLQGDRPGDIDRAAGLLRDGGLVALPTETVYGLAANALNEDAIEGIFRAKERPHWDPLIVHIESVAMLRQIVSAVPEAAERLMRTFWPGPLTLLLPRAAGLPRAVTAGRDLAGVRMPSHPVALELIRRSGLPLAAPSANRFGHISPTTAEHVLHDLDGRIDAVLDAGPCAVGVESTVLDPAGRVLYREGGVSRGEIEGALGAAVEVYCPPSQTQEQQPESLPSPGVGIRHYAPRARVLLVDSAAQLAGAVEAQKGSAVGVMLPRGWPLPPHAQEVFHWERWDDAAALARSLYTGLRTLDAAGVSIILCPLPEAGDAPLVEALRDRLLKAAR